MPAPILSVKNLRVEFTTKQGVVPVLDDLSFELQAGENICLVGESGCGKSMTSLAIMGLLPRRIAKIAAGQILFNGEDLVQLSEPRMQQIRGNQISMIFQEPMTAINPVYTIGEQIAEVLRKHFSMHKKAAWNRSVELLDLVSVPNPHVRAKEYPHQFSGGQLQRVMIAMALACEPKLLIADEPTTALDVTVQNEIFELLDGLRSQFSTAMILITHDMGVVATISDRVLVMYAGRKFEEGRVHDIIKNPQHPYTQDLISCIPHIQNKQTNEFKRLVEIPGTVPSIQEFGQDACLFVPRCNFSQDICQYSRPLESKVCSTKSAKHHHIVACWHVESKQNLKHE